MLWPGIGSVFFLGTAAASRVASLSDSRRLVMATAVGIEVLPFLAVAGSGWDVEAVYFPFGGVFGVLAGLLLRRSNRLAADLRAADARLAGGAVRYGFDFGQPAGRGG